VRMGIIGRADDAQPQLRRAIEFFLSDPEIKQIMYLGEDTAIDDVVADFARENIDEDEFLRRGVELACGGTPQAIESLLAADRETQRLSLLRRLPAPPARTIEFLEKWIVLAVHDKAVLDEDDVANAHVIIYGKADTADFKRFGPRTFLTPGPLVQGRIGRVSLRSDGGLEVSLLDLDGNSLLRESFPPTLAKLVVAS
jgi:hypothetical protein